MAARTAAGAAVIAPGPVSGAWCARLGSEAARAAMARTYVSVTAASGCFLRASVCSSGITSYAREGSAGAAGRTRTTTPRGSRPVAITLTGPFRGTRTGITGATAGTDGGRCASTTVARPATG